ncbi:hypothetical protein NW767_015120 [Fusarium falciforme]|nr:hypothetical protein NW767_015120 [Fusarium falciforme]
MPTPQEILSKPDDPQSDSPLFGLLPAETRNQIFSLALTDYEDPSPDRRYSDNVCYARPSYFAPRRTDTALLRTCRAAYRECRFLPFTLTEQTFWLTPCDYSPPGYDRLRAGRDLYITAGGLAEQMGQNRVQIEGLRVFTQMWALWTGNYESLPQMWAPWTTKFEALLEIGYVDLKRFTVTVRHVDWGHWERDAPLMFLGDWIRGISERMPPCLNEVRIEMESPERKKHQVDLIANKMAERWFFKKPDGTVLFADTEGSTMQVSRWRGTSTWNGQRWIRDETDEGVIDYYILSVTFRPRQVIEENGGKVGQLASKWAEDGVWDRDELTLKLPYESPMECEQPFVDVHEEEDSPLPADDEVPPMMKRATARIAAMGRAAMMRVARRGESAEVLAMRRATMS